MRFPAEDLTGLTAATRVAVTAARTEALWRDGVLIGVTSGFRNAQAQERLFADEIRRRGHDEARLRVLPAVESRHVAGTAVDVRPAEGALWLERHGGRFRLYRAYDNEWWHFEYHRYGPPQRLPHPGVSFVEQWCVHTPPGRVSKSPPAAGRAEAAADGTGQEPEYNPVRGPLAGTVSDHLDHDRHRPGTSRHALG